MGNKPKSDEEGARRAYEKRTEQLKGAREALKKDWAGFKDYLASHKIEEGTTLYRQLAQMWKDFQSR